MHVKNFVICDSQKEYSEKLLRVFRQKRTEGYQYYLFHTKEELKSFAQRKRIFILLLDELYFQELYDEIRADRKMLLVKHKKKAGNGVRMILRYQSADEIWKQIQKEPIKKQLSVRKSRKSSKGELLAVYSPIHRIGKTQYAIKKGKELAETESVLYLNLEEYSGIECYFSGRPDQNLGDLLYYLRQNKGNLGMKISMIAGQDENLDYIMPISYVQDLKAVKEEEWINLCERIQEECIYGKIILDLGDSIDGLYTLLGKCKNIYMPYIEEPVAAAKMKQYVENIRKLGMDEILEKTIQVRMDVDEKGDKS